MSEPGRVVVVDDEPVILDLLVTVLDGGPWRVHAFGTGLAARAHLEEHGADVLLTDKNLPDVGGLELIAELRQRDPDSECVIITGFPSLDTALEAMQLEVFDYVVKPPRSIFEVRQKVERAYEKVRIVRENRRLLAELTERNGELESALERLQRTQAELVQSEKLAGIGTLAAGVAHEVASPLFGILGLAEAIEDEDDVATMREHAAEIVEYSRGIRDIVTELTRYSRTSKDEYRTTVSLVAAVRDAVRLVTRRSGAERVVVEIPDELTVLARSNEVQQVFVNLVKNALEATANTGGKVWVRGWRDGDDAVVEVVDNGPGIPDEALGLVFDPFFTTKAPGEGTGLGLNVVYRIITRYQGSITVGHADEGGARFAVRLPSVRPEEPV